MMYQVLKIPSVILEFNGVKRVVVKWPYGYGRKLKLLRPAV